MAGDWKDLARGALKGAGSGLLLSQMGGDAKVSPEVIPAAIPEVSPEEAWCLSQNGSWTGTECYIGGAVQLMPTPGGKPANRIIGGRTGRTQDRERGPQN
jgi:hypothetical protein